MAVDRPDYTRAIALIERGETYPQFEARANEKTKIFLQAHTVDNKLAAGASVPLIDFETFLPTPYTSPAGWLADFREWMSTYDGLVRLDVVCGDFPTLTLHSHFDPYTFTHTYEQIIFFNTRFWDPYAASSHEWTFTVVNEDDVDLKGAVQVAMVLTDIGSHYPTTKPVKCLVCGAINTVPLKETQIKCKNCGAKFSVPFFPGRTV